MSETTELIKRLRERGLSQTDIAKLTGIPQPRLSRWENGDAPDSADDALKLAALVADHPASDTTYTGPDRRESAEKAGA